jgi:hypothetical protein
MRWAPVLFIAFVVTMDFAFSGWDHGASYLLGIVTGIGLLGAWQELTRQRERPAEDSSAGPRPGAEESSGKDEE